MVMTDHERGLRSSDEMMAGYPQGGERSQTDYELRLASLAMGIARMNRVDQEFLRSLLPSGPAQSSPGSPLCSVSSNNRPGATALHQMPPLVQYATFVPPRFTIFSGEGHKQETSYAQWRSEVHSVWHSGLYQEAMVVTSIRRSLRGRAADVLLAMGSDVSVEQVLAKFDVRFGDVQPSDKHCRISLLLDNCLLNLFLCGVADWRTCLVMWMTLMVLLLRGPCLGPGIGVACIQIRLGMPWGTTLMKEQTLKLFSGRLEWLSRSQVVTWLSLCLCRIRISWILSCSNSVRWRQRCRI